MSSIMAAQTASSMTVPRRASFRVFRAEVSPFYPVGYHLRNLRTGGLGPPLNAEVGAGGTGDRAAFGGSGQTYGSASRRVHSVRGPDQPGRNRCRCGRSSYGLYVRLSRPPSPTSPATSISSELTSCMV